MTPKKYVLSLPLPLRITLTIPVTAESRPIQVSVLQEMAIIRAQQNISQSTSESRQPLNSERANSRRRRNRAEDTVLFAYQFVYVFGLRQIGFTGVPMQHVIHFIGQGNGPVRVAQIIGRGQFAVGGVEPA